MREFLGSYTDYLEMEKRENLWRKRKFKREKVVEEAPKQQRKRKLSYNEQREWETIEDTIAELEEKLSQLEKNLRKLDLTSQRHKNYLKHSRKQKKS